MIEFVGFLAGALGIFLFGSGFIGITVEVKRRRRKRLFPTKLPNGIRYSANCPFSFSDMNALAIFLLDEYAIVFPEDDLDVTPVNVEFKEVLLVDGERVGGYPRLNSIFLAILGLKDVAFDEVWLSAFAHELAHWLMILNNRQPKRKPRQHPSIVFGKDGLVKRAEARARRQKNPPKDLQ